MSLLCLVSDGVIAGGVVELDECVDVTVGEFVVLSECVDVVFD